MDLKCVKTFEDDHKGQPIKDSVQMDWPLPFSSTWNAAAIHVLAQGFWDEEKDESLKESGRTFENVKALCISKLERTRRAYNTAQNADRMDAEEGQENIKETCAANGRRYARKVGVSVLVNIEGQSANRLVCRPSTVVSKSSLRIVTATRPSGTTQRLS